MLNLLLGHIYQALFVFYSVKTVNKLYISAPSLVICRYIGGECGNVKTK